MSELAEMGVRSAGPDGEMWNDDDVLSGEAAEPVNSDQDEEGS